MAEPADTLAQPDIADALEGARAPETPAEYGPEPEHPSDDEGSSLPAVIEGPGPEAYATADMILATVAVILPAVVTIPDEPPRGLSFDVPDDTRATLRERLAVVAARYRTEPPEWLVQYMPELLLLGSVAHVGFILRASYVAETAKAEAARAEREKDREHGEGDEAGESYGDAP